MLLPSVLTHTRTSRAPLAAPAQGLGAAGRTPTGPAPAVVAGSNWIRRARPSWNTDPLCCYCSNRSAKTGRFICREEARPTGHRGCGGKVSSSETNCWSSFYRCSRVSQRRAGLDFMHGTCHVISPSWGGGTDRCTAGMKPRSCSCSRSVPVHLQSLYTHASPILLGFVLSSICVGFPASKFAGGLWRCSREMAVV